MNYCDRLIKVIGEDNFDKLKNTRVLLVGLGGVGGSCFDSLVRSGIGNKNIYRTIKTFFTKFNNISDRRLF